MFTNASRTGRHTVRAAVAAVLVGLIWAVLGAALVTPAFADSATDVPARIVGSPGPPIRANVTFSYGYLIEGSPAPTVTVTGDLPTGLAWDGTGISGAATVLGTYTWT